MGSEVVLLSLISRYIKIKYLMAISFPNIMHITIYLIK